MRVLVVDTYYPAFLERHYAERPGLAESTYDVQLASLLRRHFGTGDAYARELRALGHEAQTVIANCAPFQAAWARDHGSARLARALAAMPTRVGITARERLPGRIVREQVAALRPDVVYVQDLWFFTAGELTELRSLGSFVAGQTASATPDDDVLRQFDLLVSSFPHFVERFGGLGVDALFLPIAFDTDVRSALEAEGTSVDPDKERDVPLSFVGTLNPRTHAAGTALLEELARRGLPLQLWGTGSELLDAHSPLRDRWRGEVFGLDMYRVLARSQVVLNRHIDAAEGYANNMRLFEATGAGALLATEQAPNLGELFEPGKELVAYRDVDDLEVRVKELLADTARRTAIARAGQERTLRDHTYARRMVTLAEELEKRL